MGHDTASVAYVVLQKWYAGLHDRHVVGLSFYKTIYEVGRIKVENAEVIGVETAAFDIDEYGRMSLEFVDVGAGVYVCKIDRCVLPGISLQDCGEADGEYRQQAFHLMSSNLCV